MSMCATREDSGTGDVGPSVCCGCECGRGRSGVTVVLAPVSLALTHPVGVVCLVVLIVCSQMRDAGDSVGMLVTALKARARRASRWAVGVLRRRAWFARRPGLPVAVSCSRVDGRSAAPVGENALSLSRPAQDGAALPVGLACEAVGGGEFAADMCRCFAVRWVAQHPGAVESHGHGYAGFEFAECRAGKPARRGDGGPPAVVAGVGGACDPGAVCSVADGRHW
jgi:hypothetical protein